LDKAIQERWSNELPPFNGCTLVWVKPLHKILGTAIVRYSLEKLDLLLGIEEGLYVNEDWHAHDGFIKDSEFVEKDKLFLELSSQPEKWIRVLDDLVCLGLYDPGFQFYLRIGLDEDEPKTMTFELTSDKDTVRRLASDLESSFNANFDVVDAKPYFDRIYAG
jgi:hypothetical protein